MKSAKRLLALMLTLCMLVTSLVTGTIFASADTTASLTDVSEEASYYEAVRVLNALGIIKGYPDGTFLPDKAVTRAEFTTMLVRAMDMEEIATQSYVAANMPFEDCVEGGSSYAFPNILFAYNKGIINGMDEKTFAPENEVTYEQAVKMVVCAAGYGYVVETEQGGYPNGYLARADQMNILGAVDGSMGVAATRWQIGQLLYNAFDCYLMEKVSKDKDLYAINENKTWLESFLGLYSDTGMVTADNVTSISASDNTPGVGECYIDLDKANEERAFNLGSYDVSNLIGKSVKIFYEYDKDDREYNLVYLGDLSNMTTSLVLDVEDIIDFDDLDIVRGGTLEYWKDADSDYAKRDDIDIASGVTLVLNGKAYTPSLSQFKNEMQSLVEGQVEFVSDKNSDKVSKIFITKVDTYVANTVTTDARSGIVTVVDLYRNTSANQKNTVTIDVEDTSKTIKIYDDKGSLLEKSNIAKYNTLSIVESQSSSGRNLMNIYVSTKSVSGTVTEVSSDGEVTIGGTVYEISPYYETYAVGNDASNEIRLNTTATFYLDKDNKITAMKKDSESYSYGFIYALGQASNSALDDTSYVLKYIDQAGSKKKVEIDYKIEYDGERLSPADGMQYLMDSAKDTNTDLATDDKRGVYTQLIKYSLNASGKISTIATVSNLASEYTTDLLSASAISYDEKDDGSHEAMKYTYSTSASGTFGSSPKIQINSSTIVFVVGADRDEDSIKKSSVTKEFTGNTDYIVELYDEKSNIAKVCVVYKDDTQEVVTAATSLSIIDEIIAEQSRNAEGNVGEKAAFYKVSTSFGTGEETSAETGTFTSIGVGSIAKLLENNYGDIKSVAEGSVVIWDVTTSEMPAANEWINKAAKSLNGVSYRTLVGVIESIDIEEGLIVFIPSTDFESIDESSTRETFDISDSNCGFVVYDPEYEADPVYDITYEQLAGSIVTYGDDPENATEILLHLTGSSTNLLPKLVYVINR